MGKPEDNRFFRPTWELTRPGLRRRIGYTPVRSTIALNAGCPLRLRDQVQAQIANWQQRKAGPLALIGHSRGGIIAWSIAVQMAEKVSRLAVLGSPLGLYRQSAATG